MLFVYCSVMFYSVCRLLAPRYSYNRMAVRLMNQKAALINSKQYNEQIDYIKLVTENTPKDWVLVKNDVLSKCGSVNEKNIDGVMLRYMIGCKHIEAALSFADHLRNSNKELSIGSINGLLILYTEIGNQNLLTKEYKEFIVNTYNFLYDKYKLLDSITCEKLLHALCVIDEWEKALKVLADIHLSCKPSHSAYSTIIATLFKLNKKKKALELIEESLRNKRPLQANAYREWINYILRKYKDKKVIAKYLDEVCSHIARYCVVIDANTASNLKEIYSSIEWNVQFTKIRKHDGQCMHCMDTLDCLTLSNEEFNTLQQNVKDKLIVGSDLFLKTSPDELKRFTDFIERTAPYDVVLDALNIAYAIGKGSSYERLSLLNHVVDHFVNQNKKILVLGRKHMLNWQRKMIEQIKRKTCTFFTEDLSQDDPYFITAAILSGSHTDIVSKDLLRGHQFLLKDENLRNLFKRWQWQHQWMVFLNTRKGTIVQPPLKFTPCAQKKNNGWHLPFEKETGSASAQVNDGTPDLTSWLCLRPKV